MLADDLGCKYHPGKTNLEYMAVVQVLGTGLKHTQCRYVAMSRFLVIS